jgi:SagB-type dehydrogenase family enzyme
VTGIGTPVARRYHDGTAHSPASVRSSTHTLEWDIKPFPFKVYVDAPALELPRDLDPLALPALAAVGARGSARPRPLTLAALATLLYATAGVTKKKTYAGGGEVLFRAAASTGALYQTEVYVAAGAVEGLGPGLHHFCPGDFTLRRLREGDWRGWLGRAAADEALGARAVVLVFTAIYWRNTWKYQARGFRHLFWDSGTMLANALAAAEALGLAPRLVTGFVDADANRLLGLDPAREGALELLAVGERTPPPPAGAPPEALHASVLPLSEREVDYPVLREMYEASSLPGPEAVATWRRGAAPPPRPARGPLTPLPAPPLAAGRGLDDTIQRRGSTRRFSPAPLSPLELGAALWASARPIAWDAPHGLVERFVVVNAVRGVTSGAYRYAPAPHALELLRAGDFRRESAYLCLEQPLGGEAAAVIYFLAPLDALVQAFGDRGYRLANLEAGLAGGRAYLAAYALGFGASGLTYYDRLVGEFFAPAAAGLDAIFVTALGRAAGASSGVLLSETIRPNIQTEDASA